MTKEEARRKATEIAERYSRNVATIFEHAYACKTPPYNGGPSLVEMIEEALMEASKDSPA